METLYPVDEDTETESLVHKPAIPERNLQSIKEGSQSVAVNLVCVASNLSYLFFKSGTFYY